MAKQLLCTVLMLLVPGFAQPNPLRSLLSRQLHEESDATGSGVSTWGSKTYSTTAPSQYSTPPNSSKPHPPPSQIPWELELAPFMNAPFSPRDPNSTRLVGPPRLAGVFKGSWMRMVYGSSLRPKDVLSSQRGSMVVRLPAEDNPGPDPGSIPIDDLPASGSAGGSFGPLPGGLQELRGEVVLRDGDRVTDRDIRFWLKGTYVAAAGTVHAVLQPQPPLMIRSQLDSRGSGNDDSGGGGQDTTQHPHLVGSAAAGGGGPRGGDQRGGGSGGGERGSAGSQSSGYREALRTAARALIAIGPAWHLTLIRTGVPPPGPGTQGGARRRAATVDGARGEGASSRGGGSDGNDGLQLPPSSPPPGAPLELALMQSCELRADFRVYYKGDPDLKSHMHFLRLDQVSSFPAPSMPPVRQPAATAMVVGALHDGKLTTAASTANSSAVRPLRHLTSDAEMYHSVQMQLHTQVADVEDGPSAVTSTSTSTSTAADSVFGIPQGMDPTDPDLELVGLILSPNCAFELHFNASVVHLDRYYRQATRYSVVVAAVTVAQIILSVGQSEAASTPSAAARMSIYCVTLQAIIDAYQCFMHVTGALVVESLFAAFSSLAFLQFLLFAVFEMRQTLLVWRAQRTNGTGSVADFWSVRRDMSAVYFRFYGLLLIGLLLMLNFRSQLAVLVLALHSWWVPQIVHSATTDTRPPLKTVYVWGMSALRIISPLYFYGCPSNLLQVEQHPRVCVALVTWVGLQAAVLTAQMRLGPRMLIPRVFLPHRYDYHRTATKREIGIEEPTTSTGASGADGARGLSHNPVSPSTAVATEAMATTAYGLVGMSFWRRTVSGFRSSTLLRRLAAWWRRPVLMAAGWRSAAAEMAVSLQRAVTSVRWSANRSGSGGGNEMDMETGHGSKECVICMNPVPLKPHSARMLTPCGHFFHEACLTRWMEVKMDCPTCRRPLPPV